MSAGIQSFIDGLWASMTPQERRRAKAWFKAEDRLELVTSPMTVEGHLYVGDGYSRRFIRPCAWIPQEDWIKHLENSTGLLSRLLTDQWDCAFFEACADWGYPNLLDLGQATTLLCGEARPLLSVEDKALLIGWAQSWLDNRETFRSDWGLPDEACLKRMLLDTQEDASKDPFTRAAWKAAWLSAWRHPQEKSPFPLVVCPDVMSREHKAFWEAWSWCVGVLKALHPELVALPPSREASRTGDVKMASSRKPACWQMGPWAVWAMEETLFGWDFTQCEWTAVTEMFGSEDPLVLVEKAFAHAQSLTATLKKLTHALSCDEVLPRGLESEAMREAWWRLTPEALGALLSWGILQSDDVPDAIKTQVEAVDPSSFVERFRPIALGSSPLAVTVRLNQEKALQINIGLNRLDGSPKPISASTLYKTPSLKKALYVFEKHLMQVAPLAPFLKEIAEAARVDQPFVLESAYLDTLFKSWLPTWQAVGMTVYISERLKSVGRLKMTLSLEGQVATPTGVGLKAMLTMNGDVLSEEAIGELQKMEPGCHVWQDKLIYVDKALLEQLKAQVNVFETTAPLARWHWLMRADEDWLDRPEALKKAWQQLWTSLEKGRDFVTPSTMPVTLRPYQMEGVKWLRQRHHLKMGAILADDMGLGKTLQTITFITCAIEEGTVTPEAPALIVVPASLLTNWTREWEKFSPSTKVALYYGRERTWPEGVSVILTTHGVVKRDIDKLQPQSFSVVVVDEAQAMKNPLAQLTLSVKRLASHMKVLLSGTPIENHLSDLWSLTDVVLPGWLGSWQSFQAWAKAVMGVENTPVTQGPCFTQPEEARRLLKQLTHPFILRRLKTDKALVPELPPKIEVNHPVEMNDVQEARTRALIRHYWAQTKQDAPRGSQVHDSGSESTPVFENPEASSSSSSKKAFLLGLLTHLKQVADSPSLEAHSLADEPDCPKAEEAIRLVLEAREEGRKTLIFTQYESMGERLVAWLEKALGERVPFLHGGVLVKDRMKLVDELQENPDIHAMVMTLKAGGTGLNLTRASVVIHYDLWWNPAAEQQASDRAYRIGQKSPVTVVRLISSGSVEEVIDRILQKKKALADMVLSPEASGWDDEDWALLEGYLREGAFQGQNPDREEE